MTNIERPVKNHLENSGRKVADAERRIRFTSEPGIKFGLIPALPPSRRSEFGMESTNNNRKNARV